jgi:hypothetical protein
MARLCVDSCGLLDFDLRMEVAGDLPGGPSTSECRLEAIGDDGTDLAAARARWLLREWRDAMETADLDRLECARLSSGIG